MSTILIVDDEIKIREVIREYALMENYKVLEANNGYEALDLVDEHDIDLIVLDIMMPELDGFTTLKKIKEKKDIPVIMLSARQEEFDKLHGFDLGIDDYVTKPFSLKELMARIRVVLERTGKSDNRKFVDGDLVVDFDAHTIFIGDQEVHVTPKEFEILEMLIEHENKTVSRDKFMSDVWGYDYFGDDRTIDTHIKMLRQNLGDYRECIKTVRGIGYKFERKNQRS